MLNQHFTVRNIEQENNEWNIGRTKRTLITFLLCESSLNSDTSPAVRSKTQDSTPCADRVGRTKPRNPCKNQRYLRQQTCVQNSEQHRGTAALGRQCLCPGCRVESTQHQTASSTEQQLHHSSCWQRERLTNWLAETPTECTHFSQLWPHGYIFLFSTFHFIPVSSVACRNTDNEKSAQRRHKHCALAVVRLSQKFSPCRRPPSRVIGMAKI